MGVELTPLEKETLHVHFAIRGKGSLVQANQNAIYVDQEHTLLSQARVTAFLANVEHIMTKRGL